jgi:hypothetical protein
MSFNYAKLLILFLIEIFALVISSRSSSSSIIGIYVCAYACSIITSTIYILYFFIIFTTIIERIYIYIIIDFLTSKIIRNFN